MYIFEWKKKEKSHSYQLFNWKTWDFLMEDVINFYYIFSKILLPFLCFFSFFWKTTRNILDESTVWSIHQTIAPHSWASFVWVLFCVCVFFCKFVFEESGRTAVELRWRPYFLHYLLILCCTRDCLINPKILIYEMAVAIWWMIN